MSRFSLSRPAYCLALASLVLLKLWLVRGETIVGSATQYDALWYVRSASHCYWGMPYDWAAFIRPCAYPLWIALMQLMHLPLRIAIELLQMGGALTLVFAFRTLGVSRSACLIGFSLMSFHPIGFQQNSYTMSDTFYAGVLWFVLGGLLLTLYRGNTGIAIGTGIAIAVLWNTREEGLLLVALLVLATIVSFGKGRALSQRPSGAGRFQPIVVVWATAFLLILAIYTVNDRVFGSFARSEMTAPVFQSLYHSLLRIKPAEQKPYAPITTTTLQRAFEVSPTFARLRGPLEGPLGEAWRVETFRRTGVPHEIGVGWIVWATRQAAAVEGIFASPKKARRFFSKAAQEIDHACDKGRLPTRFVLGGFLDPFAQSGAVERLPNSALRIAARVFGRWSIKPLHDDADLTKEEAGLYNRMTLRRSPGLANRAGLATLGERLVGRYHRVGMLLLHILAAVSVIFLLTTRARLNDPVIVGIALVLSAVFLRAALLCWLDATAFDATQDRFLLPILPLWSLVLVLIIALGGKAIGRDGTHGTYE